METRALARRYGGIHIGSDEARQAVVCSAQAEVDGYRFRVTEETHSAFEFVI